MKVPLSYSGHLATVDEAASVYNLYQEIQEVPTSKTFLAAKTHDDFALAAGMGQLIVAKQSCHADFAVIRGAAMIKPSVPQADKRLMFTGSHPGLINDLEHAGHVRHTAELGCLMVDPKTQKQGIGAILVDTAIAKMKQTGISHAFAYVVMGNETAVKLFGRHGFLAVGTARRIETLPSGRQRPGVQRWLLARAL
jgi:ribosomal protein S18 acetylase RimI-like enzyme